MMGSNRLNYLAAAAAICAAVATTSPVKAIPVEPFDMHGSDIGHLKNMTLFAFAIVEPVKGRLDTSYDQLTVFGAENHAALMNFASCARLTESPPKNVTLPLSPGVKYDSGCNPHYPVYDNCGWGRRWGWTNSAELVGLRRGDSENNIWVSIAVSDDNPDPEAVSPFCGSREVKINGREAPLPTPLPSALSLFACGFFALIHSRRPRPLSHAL